MAIDVVEHNPRLKMPVACVLELVADRRPHERGELESAAAKVWSDAFAQEPAVVIDVLVRAGAVVEELIVDGEAYDGTLEDIQLDESIPLEAEVSNVITVTDAGIDLSASLDPLNTLRELFAERPCYQDTFRRVLLACMPQEGASREALEQAVEAQGDVTSPEGERVYPQFFMDALESAGGISWNGAWHITDAGRKLLDAA